MIESIRNIWRIPDLRRKILFTLMMIAVYRVGTHIPTPFVDSGAVKNFFEGRAQGGNVFAMVDMFTGGAFQKMSIMTLGIMPYISAQIILQLLMIVWPYLEKLKKEGDAGTRKIEQMTRYGAIILAAFQSIGISIFMMKSNMIVSSLANGSFGFIPGKLVFVLIAMIAITTGTALLMWIGEQITHRGIGNGISLLIALGIIARYPIDAHTFYLHLQNETVSMIWVPLVAGLCILTTVTIIMIQEGSRKIPIQHARRTVGRRVTQSQTNYLPLKVNTAGVIPVIFASAILTLPQTLFSWIGAKQGNTAFGNLGAVFAPHSNSNLYEAFGLQKESIFLLLKMFNVYTILYVILVAFFCFFYTAVSFNPTDVAENLKKSGAFIPGYRPGKQTADYIDMVLTRITTVGAVFLVSVALIPQVLINAFRLDFSYAEFAGGTGLIIVVGVVLDTMKRVESQLLLRHYDGFKIRRQAPADGGSRPRWTGREK